MTTGDEEPSLRPACDAAHDEGPRPAELVLTMLDTTSLDAVSLLCESCALAALIGWLDDDESDVVGWSLLRIPVSAR